MGSLVNNYGVCHSENHSIMNQVWFLGFLSGFSYTYHRVFSFLRAGPYINHIEDIGMKHVSRKAPELLLNLGEVEGLHGTSLGCAVGAPVLSFMSEQEMIFFPK